MLDNQIGRVFFVTAVSISLLLPAKPAAAQVNSPQYVVNSSIATGSGTSNSAYFTGAAGTGYAITIQAGSNLSSPSGTDQISIDNGTVTNEAGATIGNGGGPSPDISEPFIIGVSTIHCSNTSGAFCTVNNYGNLNSSGYGAAVHIDGNGILNNTGVIERIGASGQPTVWSRHTWPKLALLAFRLALTAR